MVDKQDLAAEADLFRNPRYRALWYNRLSAAMLVYAAVVPATVCLAFKQPLIGALTLGPPIIYAIILAIHIAGVRSYIDSRLLFLLGGRPKMDVLTRRLPGYRLVDLHRAIRTLAAESPDAEAIDSTHYDDLRSILNGQFSSPYHRRISLPSKIARHVSFEEEQYFFCDAIIYADTGKDRFGKVVMRLKYVEHTDDVIFAVAASGDGHAEALAEKLLNWSVQHSIYRGQAMELRFESQVMDEYGSMPGNEVLHIDFVRLPEVTAEDVILEKHIEGVLQRNIFDFHQHRQALLNQGIPAKKGLLFYGPPGTGKTYTCQYIANQVDELTTIVVTGNSLTQMETICSLARLLQPSLVILEDVDLVFTSREINLYGTALGDFMDQMDGFHQDDAVIFILTTNAIERLEKAIRERPGRISQCVFFGPPTAELRRRYLKNYLKPYDTTDLDLEQLVEATEGATQAFLKEYVFRAVQVCLESRKYANGQVRLQNEHFETAYTELTEHNSQSSHTIVGFRIDTP